MLKYEERFSIAKLNFCVNADKDPPIRWLRELKGRFPRYSSGRKPDIRISLYYNIKKRRGFKQKKLFDTPYDVYGRIDNGLHVTAYAKRNYIPFGDILRILACNFLIKRNGFFLHSCGVKIDGGAYLFAGPSGAGKTTIAKLNLKRNKILSDETVAVVKNQKDYNAYATPFFGDLAKVTSDDNAPVKAVFFLKQSNRFGHKRLDTLRAAQALLQNIFLIGNECKDNLGRVFDIALDLVKRVPAYELGFLPKEQIWRYIEKEISPGG
ncbi:MAG: hypothetical protein PHE18_03615 [Candidatus Omnitrophica bacterium]|nr:hypothetical protein [Candidatus Omnitrophota bacterium]MDD5552945.1 hypothetical protein [Candidatus Omnitrophota bacterium]